MGRKRTMKIAIGSDHGAVEYKQILIEEMSKWGHEVKDFGTYNHESCDYADYASAVGKAVASGAYDRGIVLCGTGIGVSISANKIQGVRCSLCAETTTARLTREHNDSNVLAMGQRIIGEELMKDIAKVWLDTPFSNDERHVRRIVKITKLETEPS